MSCFFQHKGWNIIWTNSFLWVYLGVSKYVATPGAVISVSCTVGCGDSDIIGIATIAWVHNDNYLRITDYQLPMIIGIRHAPCTTSIYGRVIIVTLNSNNDREYSIYS